MIINMFISLSSKTLYSIPKTVAIRFNRAFLSTTNLPKEEKIKVGNYNINYVKVGNGPHHVLCMPGALGTIWTDFKPQVQGLNKEKFTIVAWDPVGYGKSRPPDKEFTANFYEKDADIAFEFLKELKIPKISLLGWSDGGITGLILAAKYPSAVNKLVVWGSNSFILPQELEAYKKIKDVKTWSSKMRQPMIDVYGEEKFATYWANWVEGMVSLFQAKDGNICSELLKDIKCPTLILHGEKDPLVDNVHVSHLHTHIEGSSKKMDISTTEILLRKLNQASLNIWQLKTRIHLYPDGKHNIHIRYADDFNKKVQEFLLLPSN